MDLADFDYDLPDRGHRPAAGRAARRGPAAGRRRRRAARRPPHAWPTCRRWSCPGDVLVRQRPPGCCRPGCGCARRPAARSRSCCSSRPRRAPGRRWSVPGRRVRPGTAARRRSRPDGGGGRRAGRATAPAWSTSTWATAATSWRRSTATASCRCRRTSTAPLDDPERYQTVFADRPGSVAAPTAGLHLTPAVLDACRAAGRRGRRRRAGRGPGHVPADHRRQGRGPRHARRALPRAAGRRWTPAGARRRRAGGGGGHHRRCGRSSRRPPRASSRAAPSCSSTGPTTGGWSTCCSPTSTCPGRRCSCWSTPSSAPRWRDLYAERAGRRATASCPSATPCCSTRRAVAPAAE